MTKFQLFSTVSGWNTRHASIKTYLGIPTGLTTEYAVIEQINNPSHADFGKYPFPVLMAGTWKCDDQFNPADLVNYDSTWYLPTPPE